ncbi:MAG: S8 family serine peptidase [Phycisphaerae bacterium]|nr:S8 family serine peptidase [Phycisphaerae bacterium]MDW8262297.1 S8 family serine peptidase [Phycisphaerales bacterium]
MPNPVRRSDVASLVRSCRFALESVEKRILLTTVSGTLYGDYDGDGVRDPGEPGLAGWTVFVDLNNNGSPNTGEPQVITGSGGLYSFDLAPGNYRIRAVLQPGFVQTSPAGDDGTGGWADGIDGGNNGFVDDIVGRDFWMNDNNPNPDAASSDHGTHVAGIAAARTNNAVGVAGTAGGSTIVPIKFYGTGRTWTSTDVLNAYTYAANNGIRILTTSYNVDGFVSQQAFIDALNNMYNAGVLHFNSAGNNGATNPARQRFDTTLYVVNTQSNDVRNTSSNIGWGVDISAPGTSILATSLGTTLTDFNYESKTGTSMASPNAAAVAALIWSANPTWTREQVAAQLIGSADNIDALQTTAARGLVGSGRVNSNRAVSQPIAPPKFKDTLNTPLLPGLPAEGATVATQPTAFTLDVANVFDPATMVISNFEMRGDGADNTFNTPDDVLVPMTLAFGDAAAPAHGYQVGTNRLRFTIQPGTMPPDRYRFSALPGLKDPFGQPLDGNRDGVGGDALTRTFIVGAPRPGQPLEPAPALEGTAPAEPVNWADFDFTRTEVLVRVVGERGLRELDRFVRNHPGSDVARMIDPSVSRQLFRHEGDSLVELRLRNGVDPLVAIAALEALPFVKYAEPNLIFQGDPRELIPNDPSYSSQYHHPLMQNQLAWDTTLGDARVLIGVTDDGFALAHPDLYQNIWVNQAEIPPTRLANLTDINGDGYLSMLELNNPVNIGPFKITDQNSDGRIDAFDLLAARGGLDGALNVTVGTVPIENTSIGMRDIVRPSVLASEFTFETAQLIDFVFNEDLSATLTPSALSLQNLTTQTTIPPAQLSVVFEVLFSRGRFGYTGSANGVLPDGNYRATIAAGAISDPYGNTNLNPSVLNFFVLGGDANRDRTVDLTDFGILAANFNSFATFSGGDFDYNGSAGLGDFSILAANFNTSLPMPSEASRPATLTSASARSVENRSIFSMRLIQPDRPLQQLEENRGDWIA